MKRKSLIFGFFLGVSLVATAQEPGPLLVDERDGQPYPTVQIGEQLWMAVNLNFESPGRQCYDHDAENCRLYGGLYAWEEAMEVCPAGWHLPSKEEWAQLSVFLGLKEAGQQLKASKDDPLPWDGNNASGFRALAAGAGNGEGFHRMDDWAIFWSATENGSERAWFAQLDGYWYPAPPKYKNLYLGSYYLKSNLFSVRCLRDK